MNQDSYDLDYIDEDDYDAFQLDLGVVDREFNKFIGASTNINDFTNNKIFRQNLINISLKKTSWLEGMNIRRRKTKKEQLSKMSGKILKMFNNMKSKYSIDKHLLS